MSAIASLLLRPAEAAELLAMSRSRIYELAQRGELPGAMRIGGSVRIHRPTLEAALAQEAAGIVTMKGTAPNANGTAQESRRNADVDDHRPAG